MSSTRLRIAIALFADAEELDWAGPWEVLSYWAQAHPGDGVEVFSVSQHPGKVRCARGLLVVADHTWKSAPPIDVLVYPGGRGTRVQIGDVASTGWLRNVAASGALMTSVCTGSLVFADAGLLDGLPATTHWDSIDRLANLGKEIQVRPADRFVDAGDVVTASGVSAGIDMASSRRAASVDRESPPGPTRYPVLPATPRVAMRKRCARRRWGWPFSDGARVHSMGTRGQTGTHLSRLVATALTAAWLLAAGCGNGTPAGGDPGGTRLKQLSNDPVFATLPEGATDIDTQRQGAWYQQPGFTGGGWRGPTVVVRFSTASPPRHVYRFFARQAAAVGWRPVSTGALGLTDAWAKTYPDGAPATLTLAPLSRGSRSIYSLAGGVAPAERGSYG